MPTDTHAQNTRLILLNAVTLGFETSAAAMARFGPILTFIDRVVIAVFVIEILARLIVQPFFATVGTSST